MKGKRITSFIITLLLIINIFPSLFIDIAHANPVNTMKFEDLGKSEKHINIRWAFGKEYRGDYGKYVIDLNNEWIYGDGSVGYKKAPNAISIPDNAVWAFPAYVNDTYDEKDYKYGSACYVAVRKNGITKLEYHTLSDIPAEAIWVTPQLWQHIGSRAYAIYVDDVSAYNTDSKEFVKIYNSFGNFSPGAIVDKYTHFIITRFNYDGGRNNYRIYDYGDVYYQYNSVPYVGYTIDNYTQEEIKLLDNSIVSPIGNKEATVESKIFDYGKSSIIQHGHVWSTSPNPTIDLLTKTQLGARNSGVFKSNIKGLEPGTTYYVRPYATNSHGTYYGPEEKFTTLSTSIKGYKFSYIKKSQTFTVPNGISEIIIHAKGASAQPNLYYLLGQSEDQWGRHYSGPPAYGGYMKAKMNTLPNQKLNIFVGGMYGYNGGGGGTGQFFQNNPYNTTIRQLYMGNGGGATDIRTGTNLESRIMVVGGGGGGTNYTYSAKFSNRKDVFGRGGYGAGIPGPGGNAADVSGYSDVEGGKGGTLQGAGKSIHGEDGGLGQGGKFVNPSSRYTLYGYGGGGGYYGGGAGGSDYRISGSSSGGDTSSGGGGGSAYLSSMLTLIEGRNGANYGNGEVIIEIPNKPPTISNLKPNGTDIHTSNNINITWTDNDPDKDPLEKTIKIETLDGKKIYEGKPSGENNHTLSAVDLVDLDWNGNRYEKKVKVTVTVDDLYGGVATATSQFTIYNHRPNVRISNPSLPTNVNDTFTLSGRVSDSNRDTVTIKATIDGKTKTTTINNTPTSTPSSDNWSLTWTDLEEGSYSNIKIIVTDDKGSYEEILWGGSIIIKDVLKIIDNAIKENILPSGDDKTRVILGNTNVGIAENSNNNKTISSIKSNVSNRESELFFVGQKGTTQNYIENKLTNHYGIYGENYVDSLVDLILSMNSTKDSNVFVAGDFIEMGMLFIDTEKDYEGISIEDKLKSNEELQELEETLETIIMKAKQGTLQAKYNHDPDIFDNPAGVHPKSNDEFRVVQDIEDSFIINRAEENMRGQWTLTMKGSDSTGKPLFDKYSNDETITFIIHEKPTAKINYWEDASNYYLTGENSYDIDFQFREKFPDDSANRDKGIIKYQWHYQLENGTWYKFSKEGKRVTMPKTIAGKKITGYGLTVWDYHGATDTTRETDLITPELRAKLYPELDKFHLTSPGIPASEAIKAIDIETIPFATNNLEFALYQSGTIKTPLKTLMNPGDILISDNTYYKWKDIRNYTIPKDLPDGMYKANIKGTKDSLILQKHWDIKVNTPINLKPSMPKELIAGDTYRLTATTSKYATDVRVLLYSDGKGNINVFNSSSNDLLKLNLVKEENGIKHWEVNYKVPEGTIDSGDYKAKFVARTPQPLANLPWKEGVNPNPEVVYKNFYLENLDLKNLRITDMVNHIEHEGKYPILYNNPIVPVNYKAGYYVTFKIDAIGKPDTVKMKITHPGYSKELNMIKVSETGNNSTWELRWYSDPFLKKGTIINTNVTARKNTTSINFNSKYNFNGDYLKTSGSIESDWRIDQEM